MHCEPFRMEDGSQGFICGRDRQPKPVCSVCGVRAGTQLCDGDVAVRLEPEIRNGVQRLVPKRETCDRPLCRTCAVHVPPDLDYCPDHSFDVAVVQGELFP
jgi:hypothetical protein